MQSHKVACLMASTLLIVVSGCERSPKDINLSNPGAPAYVVQTPLRAQASPVATPAGNTLPRVAERGGMAASRAASSAASPLINPWEVGGTLSVRPESKAP
jgi:hypothetical protein